MLERAPVRIEMWPLAADKRRLWCLSGDLPWVSEGELMADGDPHFMAKTELEYRAVWDRTVALHSTSWRWEMPTLLLTYVAVVETSELARIEWHGARPIDLDVFDAIGKPTPHGPKDKPEPTRLDALMDGLEEMLGQAHKNSAYAFLLEPPWGAYMEKLSPALTTMYRHD